MTPLNWLLSIAILVLLLIGAISDLRTRSVSNKITLSVMLLSLPLIYYNSGNVQNSTYVFGLFLSGLYMIGSIGGADIKVLLPVIFSVSNLFAFVVLFSAIGLAYAILKWKNSGIPYFIPISISYAAVMFVA